MTKLWNEGADGRGAALEVGRQGVESVWRYLRERDGGKGRMARENKDKCSASGK